MCVPIAVFFASASATQSVFQPQSPCRYGCHDLYGRSSGVENSLRRARGRRPRARTRAVKTCQSSSAMNTDTYLCEGLEGPGTDDIL